MKKHLIVFLSVVGGWAGPSLAQAQSGTSAACRLDGGAGCGAALLQAINGLTSNGLVARTSSTTVASRTITGTANEIAATNGDGVFGNPTLSLPSALTFTGKTVTGGTFSSPTISSPSTTYAYRAGGDVSETLAATDEIVTYTLVSTDRTITLPTAVGVAGKRYRITRLDQTQKKLTIATTSAQTINGDSNRYLAYRYDFVEVVSNGANWDVIAPQWNQVGGGNSSYPCGRIIGANMNSTADQAINIGGWGKFMVTGITTANASTSLTTAAGGVYTATSKGGTAVIAAATTYTANTTAAKASSASAVGAAYGDTSLVVPGAVLYLSLTTPQGSAATADITVSCNLAQNP